MGGTSEPSRKHYILQCLCAICHRTERSFQYGERVETESQTWQSLWHLMKCHNKSKSPACLPDYTKAQPEKLLQTGFGYYWRGDDVDVMQRGAIHDFAKTRPCDDDACSSVHTSIHPTCELPSRPLGKTFAQLSWGPLSLGKGQTTNDIQTEGERGWPKRR